MEPTLGSPSMQSKYYSPPIGFYVILAIILAIACGLPFHTPVKNWLRETFRKFCYCILSCLRICVCGSKEAERGADAPEQIEMNDLPNDQLDIHHQQNGDYLGAHRGRQQLQFELRDLQNNQIEFRPDGGHLRG